jgi:hypothetical protein
VLRWVPGPASTEEDRLDGVHGVSPRLVTERPVGHTQRKGRDRRVTITLL